MWIDLITDREVVDFHDCQLGANPKICHVTSGKTCPSRRARDFILWSSVAACARPRAWSSLRAVAASFRSACALVPRAAFFRSSAYALVPRALMPELPPPLQRARTELLKAEGADVVTVRTQRDNYLELANSHALALLAQDDLKGAFQLLEDADSQAALDPESPLAAVTANNLACYYRRKGKSKTALAQLRRAVEIESKSRAPRGLADTQINLCVVLSELGQHDFARQHAAQALRLIESEADGEPVGTLAAERIAVYASALHNLAVEQAFLGLEEESASSRATAWTLAESRLGVQHPVTIAIRAARESQRKVGGAGGGGSSSGSSVVGVKRSAHQGAAKGQGAAAKPEYKPGWDKTPPPPLGASNGAVVGGAGASAARQLSRPVRPKSADASRRRKAPPRPTGHGGGSSQEGGSPPAVRPASASAASLQPHSQPHRSPPAPPALSTMAPPPADVALSRKRVQMMQARYHDKRMAKAKSAARARERQAGSYARGGYGRGGGAHRAAPELLGSADMLGRLLYNDSDRMDLSAPLVTSPATGGYAAAAGGFARAAQSAGASPYPGALPSAAWAAGCDAAAMSGAAAIGGSPIPMQGGVHRVDLLLTEADRERVKAETLAAVSRRVEARLSAVEASEDALLRQRQAADEVTRQAWERHLQVLQPPHPLLTLSANPPPRPPLALCPLSSSRTPLPLLPSHLPSPSPLPRRRGRSRRRVSRRMLRRRPTPSQRRHATAGNRRRPKPRASQRPACRRRRAKVSVPKPPQKPPPPSTTPTLTSTTPTPSRRWDTRRRPVRAPLPPRLLATPPPSLALRWGPTTTAPTTRTASRLRRRARMRSRRRCSSSSSGSSSARSHRSAPSRRDLPARLLLIASGCLWLPLIASDDL